MKRERKKPIEATQTTQKTEEEIIQERLTWQNEAKKTLTILEKDYGVNIYEENRFGGMYLRQKNGKTLAEMNKLSEIFTKNDSINTKETSSIDESQLASFFKK